MNVQDGLLLLVTLCEKSDIRLTLEYDVGRSVSGKFLDLNNLSAPVPPEHIEQGPKGWTVQVDMMGDGELHTLPEAIAIGLAVLKDVIKD